MLIQFLPFIYHYYYIFTISNFLWFLPMTSYCDRINCQLPKSCLSSFLASRLSWMMPMKVNVLFLSLETYINFLLLVYLIVISYLMLLRLSTALLKSSSFNLSCVFYAWKIHNIICYVIQNISNPLPLTFFPCCLTPLWLLLSAQLF